MDIKTRRGLIDLGKTLGVMIGLSSGAGSIVSTPAIAECYSRKIELTLLSDKHTDKSPYTVAPGSRTKKSHRTSIGEKENDGDTVIGEGCGFEVNEADHIEIKPRTRSVRMQ